MIVFFNIHLFPLVLISIELKNILPLNLGYFWMSPYLVS